MKKNFLIVLFLSTVLFFFPLFSQGVVGQMECECQGGDSCSAGWSNSGDCSNHRVYCCRMLPTSTPKPAATNTPKPQDTPTPVPQPTGCPNHCTGDYVLKDCKSPNFRVCNTGKCPREWGCTTENVVCNKWTNWECAADGSGLGRCCTDKGKETQCEFQSGGCNNGNDGNNNPPGSTSTPIPPTATPTNTPTATPTNTPTPTPTPTPAPEPWVKLKNVSYYSKNSLTNKIPVARDNKTLI